METTFDAADCAAQGHSPEDHISPTEVIVRQPAKLRMRACPQCGLTQCCQPNLWTWFHFIQGQLAYECSAARRYAVGAGIWRWLNSR